MSEKEPEVVHLEWERVEDPERDPPPELVVVEAEPPKSNPVRDYLNQPNPLRGASDTAIAVVVILAVIAYQLIRFVAGKL